MNVVALIRWMCCLAVVLGVGACSSVRVSDEAPPVPEGNIIGEYKIGVGDELRINVWNNTELSMTVPVRPDGKISLPLVGDVSAQGFTAKQLANNLSEGLKSYIRSPQVDVIVTNAGSVDYLLRVRITGAVTNPMSLPHKDGMTVLDLVLEAGGPTQYASSNSAKLYRKVNGDVKVYAVKLKDILNKGDLQTNFTLAPSDIVIVPERLF